MADVRKDPGMGTISWLVKAPVMLGYLLFAGVAWFLEQAESLRDWRG